MSEPLYIRNIPGQEQPLKADDLDRIIVADGVTARSATDRQFYEWANSLEIAFDVSESPDDAWPMQHRLNLCNYLYKLGEIRL